MGKVALNGSEIDKIVELRSKGHSLLEIKGELNRGYGTIFKYIKNVKILPQYQELWKKKRGGSRFRAEKEWLASRVRAKELCGYISKRDRLFILASLYWGEGNKKELNLINSDPELVRVFLKCLEEIGVSKSEVKVGVRVYEDVEIEKVKGFWSGVTKIPVGRITGVDVLKGKKKGKLPYGMCRIRVTRSKKYFKVIMSMIQEIKEQI